MNVSVGRSTAVPAGLTGTIEELVDRLAPNDRGKCIKECLEVAEACAKTCPREEKGCDRTYIQNLLKLAQPYLVDNRYSKTEQGISEKPIPGVRQLISNAHKAYEECVDRGIDGDRRWNFLRGYLVEARVAVNVLDMWKSGFKLIAVSARSYGRNRIESPDFDRDGNEIPGTVVSREVDMVIDYDEKRIEPKRRNPKHIIYFVETKASPRVFVESNSDGKHQALAMEHIADFLSGEVKGGGIHTAVVLNNYGFLYDDILQVDAVLAKCKCKSPGGSRPALWTPSLSPIDLNKYR